VTEIACPPTCGYLTTAREHPAAVVRKQHERDMAALVPLMGALTERQYELLTLFHTVVIGRHKPEGFARLIDDDVAEAADAVAKTLETAARGVIYEHAAQTATAQRLAGELKALIVDMRQRGARVLDREVALVLRTIEKGAREMRRVTDGGEAAYLTLMGRVFPQAPERERGPEGSSLLIQP
jgi:hypothetical protein